MDPEKLEQIIREILTEGFTLRWYVYIILAIVSFLAGVLGTYMSAYFKKRAEHLATRADIDEIVEQLKKTTAATEEIKGKISKEVWVEQKRWDLKRELYSSLLENLYQARDAVSNIMESEERVSSKDEATKKSAEEYREKQWDRETQAVQIVSRITATAGIILSIESINVLENLLNEWTEADRTQLWWEHLVGRLDAANNAYKAILEAAKNDLKV